MKFLKTQNISRFNINDNTIIAYPKGLGPGSRVVIDASGGLMLPKGTTLERPQLTGVRQPTDATGTIRYNTTTYSIEAYIGSPSPAWEVVRAPGVSTIIKQTLGPGDSLDSISGERLFGGLNTTYSAAYVASLDNIIVLVENVMQISNTNYTIIQNPCLVTDTIISFDTATSRINSSNTAVVNFLAKGYYPTQTIIVSGSSLNNGTYTVNTVAAGYIEVVEALSTEAAGSSVTVTGYSSATGYLSGVAYPSGYYVSLGEPVPDTKYVTIYYGYAN
jgi:hypothetical protein